jgi:hypothetical protein
MGIALTSNFIRCVIWLVPGFLSRKARKYGHPSTAHLPFRHSGMVLAGIKKYAGVDSGYKGMPE